MSYLVIHTLRYCVDMVGKRRNWIWQYCSTSKNKIQCNICLKVYSDKCIRLMKAHLFRAHEIFHDEEKHHRSLIWQYFTEEGRYTLRCKICNNIYLSGYKVSCLKRHLMNEHSPIIDEILQKFKHLWVSGHFILHTSSYKLQCKICHKMFSIFCEDVPVLTDHFFEHDINERTQKNIEGNNTIEGNIKINRSVTEENNAANFSLDWIHSQAKDYQKNNGKYYYHSAAI